MSEGRANAKGSKMTYAAIRHARKSKTWKTRQANARRMNFRKRALKAWRTKRANAY
jgi:hypothetical protein